MIVIIAAIVGNNKCLLQEKHDTNTTPSGISETADEN